MTTTAPPPPKLKNITTLDNGRFRVRVYFAGEWRGTYHDHLDKAIAERDALLRVKPERQSAHVPGEEEHLRQVAALPPGTNWKRNIVRIRNRGYNVKISRGQEEINGGFFSGPEALLRAVQKRDALEAKYPKTR